jgi:hypothetical protein
MAKLKKKTFFHHVGKVHDLTVENSHTYNVEGKAVHNSAAGALVAYVLGITNLDPIEYDLPFERFMNPSRCLVPGTFVKTPDGYCRVENLKEGDLVIGGSEKPCHVKRTFLSKSKKTYRFHVGENVFECSPNHLWIVRREGKDIEIQAQHILETDKLLLLNTCHHEED